MKIIIVSGKSGVGKTTVTGLLAQKEGVEHICVDDIVERYKMGSKIVNIMQTYKKNTEKTTFARKINDGTPSVYELSENETNEEARKRLIQISMKINFVLKQMVEEKSKKNPDFLVIDFLLPNLLYCWRTADERILVTKSLNNRIEHLKKRKRRLKGNVVIDEDNIRMRDALSYCEEYTPRLREYDYIIENEGNIEDLQEMVDQVFSFIKTNNGFDSIHKSQEKIKMNLGINPKDEEKTVKIGGGERSTLVIHKKTKLSNIYGSEPIIVKRKGKTNNLQKKEENGAALAFEGGTDLDEK